jgi:hypothetical protein
MRYGMNFGNFILRRSKIVTSKQALDPYSLLYMDSRDISSSVKRMWCEADHWCPSSGVVKNVRAMFPFPKRLHVMVFSQLSTKATLPYFIPENSTTVSEKYIPSQG